MTALPACALSNPRWRISCAVRLVAALHMPSTGVPARRQLTRYSAPFRRPGEGARDPDDAFRAPGPVRGQVRAVAAVVHQGPGAVQAGVVEPVVEVRAAADLFRPLVGGEVLHLVDRSDRALADQAVHGLDSG